MQRLPRLKNDLENWSLEVDFFSKLLLRQKSKKDFEHPRKEGLGKWTDAMKL